MVTDPVADMLTIIRNGYLARKAKVVAPYSRFKLAICQLLEKEKFIKSTQKKDSKIEITLYEDQKPKITMIKKISKPGLRTYIKSKNISKIKGGKGILIISTPHGVVTGQEAKAKKLGGEIICEVW